MKRISLLVAGCLCLSAAVFAGQVITNDTGEDATGLRVTFSSPVLITSFGDILTTVDQAALSYEFVFSGGTVKPWESQWFNYAPATASVVSTEWLTGPVVQELTGEETSEHPIFTGDLTNPEYLAHPAYVMQGASGHDEIFAMPLDGIDELGFYPLRYAALVQDATWSIVEVSHPEGISASIEGRTLYIWGNSPDWAGYGEVTLEVKSGGESASLIIPVTVFESDRALTSPDGKADYFVPWGWELDRNRILSVEAHAAMYGKTTEFLDRSVNWSMYMRMEPLNDVTKSLWWSNELVTNGWWTQEAQRNLVDMILLELHEANAGMVHIVNPYFLARATSTEFYPVYDRWATGPTMRPEEIEYFVNECHRLGMKTLVAPNICVDPDKNQGRWFEVSDLRPPSVGQLLDSYEGFILPRMQDWKDLGVDFLCVGRSLDMFGEDTVQNREVIDQKLIDLIDSVKTFFPGPVAAMGGTRHHWFGNTPYPDRVFHGHGDFVSLGVMNYFDPVVDIAEPTVEEMIEGWKTRIEEYYQPFQQRYRKPFIPFDNGSWSVDNGDQYGSYALLVGYASEEETRNPKQFTKEDANPTPQAIYYESFLSAFSKMEGYYGPAFYRIEFQSVRQAAGGLDDWTMTPRGKPAWEVMASYFGGFVASQVVVDAKLDDWPDGATVVGDAEGDQARASEADIAEARFFQDPRYLYVAVSYNSGFTGKLEVKVDLDGDYAPDYLVTSDQWEEDPMIATVSRVADNYATVGFADIRVVDDVLELRIDKICIGKTSVAGVQVNQIADSSRYALMDSVAYTTLDDHINPLSPSSLNPDYFINSACVMQGVSDREDICAIPLGGIEELGIFPVTDSALLSSLTWAVKSSNAEGISAEIEDAILYIWGASPTWLGVGEVALTAEDPYGNRASVEIPVTVFKFDRTLINEDEMTEYYIPWDPQLDINRILSVEEHMLTYGKDEGALDRTINFSKWRQAEQMNPVNCGTRWLNSSNTNGWSTDKQFATVDTVLRELVDQGVDSIKIDPCWFSESLTSTDVIPLYDYSDIPTWTDEEIRYVVNEAHRLGITVVGSLQYWALDEMEWCGYCRQFITPSSWDKWMASYTDLVRHLASLYSELGADIFCPGVELYNFAGELDEIWGGHSTSRYLPNDEWNRSMVSMIKSLRGIYSGPITWAAAPLPLNLSDDTAYERMYELFACLDIIGLNAYFHPFGTSSVPNWDEVIQRWETVKNNIVDPIAREFAKPIIFTEAGAASSTNALRQSIPANKQVDLEAQLLYYQGLMETFRSDPQFLGAFWWDYGLTATAGFEPTSGGIWDWEHTPRLKPAMDYLINVYGGNQVDGDLVRLDGLGAEWQAEDLLAEDPADTLGSPDIAALHAKISSRYLYLHVKFHSTVSISTLPYVLFFLDLDGDGRDDNRISFGVSHGRHVATLLGGGSDSTTYGFADAVMGDRDLELRLPLVYFDRDVTDLGISFAMHRMEGSRAVWLDTLGFPEGGFFWLHGEHTMHDSLSNSVDVEATTPESQYESGFGTTPQAIEAVGELAYVIDWSDGGLYASSLDGSAIQLVSHGFGHVSDMASDENVLLIVDESGMAWSYDTQSSATTLLDLGGAIEGETLGVEHYDGSLFLLQYGSTGPMIQAVTEGEVESFPIDAAGAGELISLQMYDGTLMSIDYGAGIVYRLVLTGDVYSLEPYLVLSHLVPRSEQADGGIRGMYLTDDVYYFTSISNSEEPGKLHVVPVEEGE